MDLNSRDDQAKKTKTLRSQSQASLLMSDQLEVAEKAKEKARKEKKRREHPRMKKKRREYHGKQDRWEGRDGSLTTTGANTTQTIEDQKKNWHNSQGSKRDILEITCYNCNKKGHYSRDCTKPKN